MSIGLKNFEECIEKVTYGNKIQRTEYLDKGMFPVVSQESKLINGFWNNEEDLYIVKQPVIVFGDHTRILKFIDFSFVLGADGTKIIKPKSFIDSKFFYYFLEANPIQSKGYSRHYRFLKELKINVPPLATQQKTVAKLDALFAEIDTATATAEANVNNAKQLFESYLKNVFENKSKKFESKKINEISINLDSKRVPITKDLRTNGDVPYYGASGIVDYVSDFLFEEDILLVSEDGANLLDRNYPIAFSVSGKSWVNNHAHVLKFENMISQKFVEFYLNSISLKPYVSGMAQPKLNQGMLNKIPIPFPNITIQKDLVNDFETMKENRNILLNSYVKKNSELALLKNSILQKAFSG